MATPAPCRVDDPAGTGLAGGVYLSSWALTGIGKILTLMGPATSFGRPAEGTAFSEALSSVLYGLSGYTPTMWASVLWVAVLIGLGVAAYRGAWRVTLLILLVSLSPWLSFPGVSSKHFFTARYVFVALIGFSVGLGVLTAWLWQAFRGTGAKLARTGVVAGLVVTAAIWSPIWRDVYTVPKMEVRKALAPIVEHATEQDVLVLVPDWYASLNDYYSFGDKVRIIRPPKEARYAILEVDKHPGRPLNKPFVDDFERLYAKDANAVNGVPPAAWLFILEPEKRLDEVQRLLEAYGLNTPELKGQLTDASRGAFTLTARLSQGRIDHIVKTISRQQRK